MGLVSYLEFIVVNEGIIIVIISGNNNPEVIFYGKKGNEKNRPHTYKTA